MAHSCECLSTVQPGWSPAIRAKSLLLGLCKVSVKPVQGLCKATQIIMNLIHTIPEQVRSMFSLLHIFLHDYK